jgi:hypothetical protein
MPRHHVDLRHTAGLASGRLPNADGGFDLVRDAIAAMREKGKLAGVN